MVWLVVALIIFIIQMATILILEYRKPSKTIAWLFVMFVFPLIGFVMYYFLAREYKHRRKMRKHRGAEHKEPSRVMAIERSNTIHTKEEIGDLALKEEPRLMGLLLQMPNCPITLHNEVKLLTDGIETYRALFKAIRHAQHHIHLEYYIVRSDKVGMALQKLLIRKVKEGVQVRFILDGVGCHGLDKGFIPKLRANGIQCAVFLPPLIALFDKRINFRNHRKTVIVDGKIGFVGGINLGQEYLGYDQRLGYWRDTHLQLRGDSVYFLQHTFMADWNFVTGEEWNHRANYMPPHDCKRVERVQMISSGPHTTWNGIMETFFTGITTASKRIYITSPYHILDPSMGMALKTAAYSGVDVRIILPGVTDSRIVYLATVSYVGDLMRAGIRCYQYQKGFNHAKVMIIDHLFASVGTTNMDLRSFYSNFELNAILFEKPVIDQLVTAFMADLDNSKEMSLEQFENRSRWQKGKEVLARIISPLF